MYKKISDYGIIGNSRTLALVGNDGSIDWLCLPYMDSPSVLAALLDERRGGRFSVQPTEDWDSVARYVPGANILQTMFRTRRGVMKLTDFIPVSRDNGMGAASEGSEIYRCVEATRGELTVGAVFDPRFDYARKAASLKAEEGAVIARGGKETLVLQSTTHGQWTLGRDGARAVWRLKAGEGLWLRLQCGGGQGRFEDAENLLSRLGNTANHLGLFSEEYDARWREALGNFPQAFTHIGCINSVVSLCNARARLQKSIPEKTLSQEIEQKLLITIKYPLNQGDPPREPDSADIAQDLKRLMNTLRGAYFRTAEGRIAYEEMAGSRVYREYVQCSLYLNRFELSYLQTRNEQLAFWINLFNVLVIHGVIASGIRDSVKEMPRFFRRIHYRIDGLRFSPDDIEHGILRSNHRLPHSVFKPFGSDDPRRRFVIGEVDPRIHFALVCASSSCPPIDIYTAENLDEDFRISGKTFINAGGIRVDRERRTVRLSRVFKWYGEDFGKTEAERLRYIAPYLYDDENRRFLTEKADSINVEYQPYDWRLNRT